MKHLLAAAVVVLMPSLAWAQAPVTIFCGTSLATAVACGTSANPIYTQPASGGTPTDVNLNQVGGAATQTGHGTAAGTVRVELPTDGTGVVGLNAGAALIGKVGIDQTTPGTTNGVVVNSSALPTGAALDATLTTISGKLGTLGQKNMAGSAPVVIASDQSAIPVSGSTAEGATASGTMQSGIMAEGRTTSKTAVTDGQMTRLVSTVDGRLVTSPYGLRQNYVSGAITSAMTGTTSTSLVAAPGANLFNCLTTIVVSNSHATVGTDILIQDGSGGTTLMVIPAAPAFNGAAISLPTPLCNPTANTAIYAQNVTTGSNTKVSAVGFKSP